MSRAAILSTIHRTQISFSFLCLFDNFQLFYCYLPQIIKVPYTKKLIQVQSKAWNIFFVQNEIEYKNLNHRILHVLLLYFSKRVGKSLNFGVWYNESMKLIEDSLGNQCCKKTIIDLNQWSLSPLKC